MRTEEFSDQIVLITGGSSGIGLATAQAFAECGAKLALLARDANQLEIAAKTLAPRSRSGSILTIACDVRHEIAIQTAYQAILDEYGDLHVVINNAGTIRAAAVEDTSLEVWNEMIDIHCTGYFLIAREAVRTFRALEHGGVIVFVASDNAVRVSSGLLAYNVAKAAELHMARCIADECGAYGIRVNSVLPGAVFGNSGFWTKEFRKARASIHDYDPDHLEEEYKKGTALGDIIYPEEVSDLILFLSSSRSAKITGAAVSIDAGGKAGYVR